MATTVSQSYTSSQNVSITRKGGVIVKVSLWTTGASADKTVRHT